MPRPKLPIEEKRQFMGAKLEPALLAKIENMADETGLSKTAVIQSLLINGLGLVKGGTALQKENMEASAEKESSSNLDDQSRMDEPWNDYDQGIFESGLKEGLEQAEKNVIKKVKELDLNHGHSELVSYIPRCPGRKCGKPNPNFPGLENLVSCDDCRNPVGTEQEIRRKVAEGIKSFVCPWCGMEAKKSWWSE